MEETEVNNKTTVPVCSCPDWERTGSQVGSLTKRDGESYAEKSIFFERPPSVAGLNDSYTETIERPQSRVSTTERPNSRASGAPFERPTGRVTVTYERPGSRTFERPNSRMGDHYERPSGCGLNASGVFDNRILSAVVLERPCGLTRPDGSMSELRSSQSILHCTPNREFERVPQVHSLCCAEWENGLGPQSEWDIDVDIRQHIQQCTCTCNHMGYGNYMDYQVSRNFVYAKLLFVTTFQVVNYVKTARIRIIWSPI